MEESEGKSLLLFSPLRSLSVPSDKFLTPLVTHRERSRRKQKKVNLKRNDTEQESPSVTGDVF